jgi:hypothetical protein
MTDHVHAGQGFDTTVATTMGLSLSALADKAEPVKVVLVPPMFERNAGGVAEVLKPRWVESAYNGLGSKRRMRALLEDFGVGSSAVQGFLFLQPPQADQLVVLSSVSPNDGESRS